MNPDILEFAGPLTTNIHTHAYLPNISAAVSATTSGTICRTMDLTFNIQPQTFKRFTSKPTPK